MNADIKTKLINSDSISNIFTELRVYELLKQNKWRVIHSPYYLDPETNKLRETDVCARQIWETKKGKIKLRFNLISECKSLKDYHILGTCLTDNLLTITSYTEYWLGLESYKHYSSLKAILSKNPKFNTSLDKFINEVDKKAFPNDLMTISNLRFNKPLCDIPVCNSFKETNIGSEKNLENSVVWKAGLSLNSVIQSCINKNWKNLDSNLNAGYLYENLEEYTHNLWFYVESELNVLEVYHPVLIVDSNLWIIQEGQLIETPYFRLIQSNYLGHIKRWFDVVSLANSETYFETLTNELSKHCVIKKMKRTT